MPDDLTPFAPDVVSHGRERLLQESKQAVCRRIGGRSFRWYRLPARPDRHWKRARLVLVCGAMLHLLFGVRAATVVDVQEVAPGPLSILFDAVPAVLALATAFLVAPPPGEHARR